MPRDFLTFNNEIDQRISREVLSGAVYPEVPYFGQVRTVVDVGANVGAAAFCFADRWPQATVFAFEPSPKCCQLLKRNASAFNDAASMNRIIVLPVGLGMERRTVKLYTRGSASVAASLLQGDGTGKHETVHIEPAIEALNDIPTPDVLKLDTEGCEVEILNSLASVIGQVGIIYVEYHSAEDRLWIEGFLQESHLLCYGKISHAHNGELCYVRKYCVPHGVHAHEIKSQRNGELCRYSRETAARQLAPTLAS